MTLKEHNEKWKANRKKTDNVFCHTGGYSELSQYDLNCASCWLGHQHTWEHHDNNLKDKS